jgi:hypothetical protein
MKQWVEHKPMSGTNVLKRTELELRTMSIQDGRPSTSKNEENNQRVLKVIHSNCHMTIHEVVRFSLKIWAGIALQPNFCRSCCVKIRNKIMFLSVKSLLIMQMLLKTFKEHHHG